MNQSVTVAIITRNRAKLLEKCLQSLTKQTVIPKEILVVDNASKDQTREIVDEFKNEVPIRYIYEPKIGIPHARNRALKEARGEILAFIDDDCQAASNWIDQIIRTHQLYKNAIAVQGISLCKSNLFGILSQKYHLGWIKKNLKTNNEISVLDTKNVSFKKNLLEKQRINFDKSFQRGSDANLAYQLLSQNQILKFTPKIKVRFEPRSNLLDFLGHRFQVGFYKAKLEHKWGQLAVPDKNNRNRTSKSQSGKSISLFLLSRISKIPYVLGHKIGQIITYSDFQKLALRPVENKNLPTEINQSKPLKLSVMIITKDRPMPLARCLESLCQQTKKPHQVIIVDSSQKSNISLIESFKEKLPITYLSENRLGFGVARNRALENAIGDIVTTIDDDEEASLSWCQEIIKAHQNAPDVTAIQGRFVCQPQKSVLAIVEQIRLDRWFLTNLNYGNLITAISTKNFSFKKKIIQKLGLKFKEDSLYGQLGDDVDFGNQLISAKQKILYSSAIIVHHWERSTLASYLKQQYRKGRSRALIKRDWSGLIIKVKIPGLPWFIKYPMDVFIHPRVKQNLSKLPLILSTYFLAVMTYFKGIKDMAIDLSKSSFFLPKLRISKVRAKSLTVAIITRDRPKQLERALFSLANQTIIPTTILVIDNGTNTDTKATAENLKKYLPIEYLYEEKTGIPFARNRALKETKTGTLAFLDDDCQATSTWVENMINAHQKFPQAIAIQGRSTSLPKNSLEAVVAQFNRQTWFRDNMLGNKSFYKESQIFICDTRNLSLKIKRIDLLRLKFDESHQRGTDFQFAKQLLSEGERIIFYPKALVFHWERPDQLQFLKQAWYQGRTYQRLRQTWPREYFSEKYKSFPRKLAAFIYYCLRNKQFLKFPLLVIEFILYRKSYRDGRKYEKKNFINSESYSYELAA